MNTTHREHASAEREIRELLNEWSAAHHARDAARLMSHCTADTVQFILAPPLQYSGAKAWDQRALEAWFGTFEGPIGYEVHEPTIVAGNDAAFCHFLNRLSAAAIDGGPFAIWDRVTFGLRKIAGRWRVLHVHQSVPFYMDGSFRAAVDLKP